ncbi:hypothetical protein RFI_09866, partial [Reticulomyxa filosa]
KKKKKKKKKKKEKKGNALEKKKNLLMSDSIKFAIADVIDNHCKSKRYQMNPLKHRYIELHDGIWFPQLKYFSKKGDLLRCWQILEGMYIGSTRNGNTKISAFVILVIHLICSNYRNPNQSQTRVPLAGYLEQILTDSETYQVFAQNRSWVLGTSLPNLKEWYMIFRCLAKMQNYSTALKLKTMEFWFECIARYPKQQLLNIKSVNHPYTYLLLLRICEGNLPHAMDVYHSFISTPSNCFFPDQLFSYNMFIQAINTELTPHSSSLSNDAKPRMFHYLPEDKQIPSVLFVKDCSLKEILTDATADLAKTSYRPYDGNSLNSLKTQAVKYHCPDSHFLNTLLHCGIKYFRRRIRSSNNWYKAQAALLKKTDSLDEQQLALRLRQLNEKKNHKLNILLRQKYAFVRWIIFEFERFNQKPSLFTRQLLKTARVNATNWAPPHFSRSIVKTMST